MIHKLSNTSNLWKLLAVVLVLGLVIISFAMCTKDEPTQVVPEEPEQLEEPADTEEINKEEQKDEEPKYRAPLTNEGTDTEVNTRPFAVFVENSPAARPQSGLDKADIVYEVLAEGAVTRFVAIYQSQKPETIGPIRSAREYMLDLAGDYDAVIVHAGGSPAALKRIEREKLPSLSEITAGGYFKRESFRKKPHNVYSNLDLLAAGAKARNFRDTYELPAVSFVADGMTVKGNDAREIVVPYSSGYQVKYIYDQHSGSYHRFINNMPHNDMTTNQQLRAANVAIVYARHSVLDNEGRLGIDLRSSGKGYIIQQGKAQEVTWRYSQGMIRFYSGDQEVTYYPGNTWVQVVPDLVAVSVQN